MTYKKVRYFLGSFENIGDAAKIRKKAEAFASDGDIESLENLCTSLLKLSS